jgi:hypothetical protein
VCNLALDEFIEWFGLEPRPGVTNAIVKRTAGRAGGPWDQLRVHQAPITAVRKLAIEAADNGLLAPDLAAGISRVKGAKSAGRSR